MENFAILKGRKTMRNIEIERFTLSRNDGFMEGWPDMIRLQSGRILVIYNECTAHLNRDNTHITMRKSDDNGITWSEKQYIGEETHHGDQWNSIRVNQLSDGRIVLVCDRINKNENTDTTKFYTFESTDDGDTWSEKYDIGVFGFCSDKVRELSDGSLLLCVSRTNQETKKAETKETKTESKEDLSTKTLAELKNIAKEKGIKGYSTMKKDELLANLK